MSSTAVVPRDGAAGGAFLLRLPVLRMAGDTERWRPARCVTPLFERLDRWVDEWIARQHSKAQADFDASLVVVERFDGLLRKVGWLGDPLREDGIDRWEFQAAVALPACSWPPGR